MSMNVMEATDVSMVVKTCLEVTGAAALMAICSTISGINVLVSNARSANIHFYFSRFRKSVL